MEDIHKTLANELLTLNRTTRDLHGSRSTQATEYGGDYDSEVWKTLCIEFERVQSVLDQNRALIEQVNQNHQSKSPDNLVKNVALIREINSNISKVVSIYSHLSINFTDLIRQRKSFSKTSNGGGDDVSEVLDASME